MELYLCKDANDFCFSWRVGEDNCKDKVKRAQFCKEEAVEKGSREERERRRK